MSVEQLLRGTYVAGQCSDYSCVCVADGNKYVARSVGQWAPGAGYYPVRSLKGPE